MKFTYKKYETAIRSNSTVYSLAQLYFQVLQACFRGTCCRNLQDRQKSRVFSKTIYVTAHGFTTNTITIKILKSVKTSDTLLQYPIPSLISYRKNYVVTANYHLHAPKIPCANFIQQPTRAVNIYNILHWSCF
jgi:hypothetical protein